MNGRPGPGKISRAEFCRLVGAKSRSAATNAVTSGRLHGPALSPDGQLILPEAWDQWHNRHPRADLSLPPPQPALPIAAAESQTTAAPDPAPAQDPQYREAMTDKAKAEAEAKRIKVEQLKDTLRPKADILRAFDAVGREVRQLLTVDLPGRSVDIAAELKSDPIQLRAVLMRVSQELLERASHRLAEAAQSLRLEIDPSPAPVAEETAPHVPEGIDPISGAEGI